MRRHNYRVWDFVNKEMVRVRTIDFDLSGNVEEVDTETYCWSDRREGGAMLSNIALLESTGRYDKKGVEIFEADRLKQNFENEMGSFGEAVGVIEYCPAHCALEAVLQVDGERRGFAIGINSEVVGHRFLEATV